MCSEIREALSAAYDGEPAPLDPAVVAAHVAGCTGCAAFERSLALLGDRTGLAAREATPDLVGAVLQRRRPQRHRLPSLELVLRWGIGLSALGELLTSAWTYWSTGAIESHDSHESLCFTVALCIGLIYVAGQPKVATSYLPVMGMAALLLTLSAAVDVDDREVSIHHELSHAGLLVGCALLGLLAWAQHGRPGPWRHLRLRRRTTPIARPQLRLLRIAGATLLTGALVLVAAPAGAHAVLEGSTPGTGALLKTAPTEVVLHYDEAVTLLPDSVRVFAPDGSRADSGDAGHAGSDATTAEVGFTGTEQGTYLVSWRVVSADSHPVSGAFTFSVGTTSAAPTATELKDDPAVAGLLGVARWIGYAGTALLVGGFVFLAWIWREGRTSRAVRRLLIVGSAGIVVSSIVLLLAKGALDAGLGLSAVGRGSLVKEVVHTTYGRATLVRLVVGLIGVGISVLLTRLPRWRMVAAATIPGLALAGSWAAAGHAVSQPDRPLALVIDGVHVISMSLWLGGLAVLVIVLRQVPDPTAIARRYSGVALGAVVALVGTGVYQAWRQIGAWGAFTATTYGKELIAKIAVVAVVLVVAGVSRQALWRDGAVARLRRAVAVEAVGAIVVLGITSALVATTPAQTAYHPDVSASVTIEGDLVQVSAVPAGDRTMDLHLYVFGSDNQPVDPAEITATVSLPSQSVGPLPITLSNGGVGHRIGAVAVPMTGEWQLAITLRTTAFDEGTQYVTLPIR